MKIRAILGASILLTCCSSVNAALITSGDKIKFDFDFSSDLLQPIYTYMPWGYDNFFEGEPDPQAILWEPGKEVKLTIFNKDGIVEYESLYSNPLSQSVPDLYTIFPQELSFNDTLGSFQLESIDAEFSMLNFEFLMCKQLQDGSNDCTDRLEFDEEAIATLFNKNGYSANVTKGSGDEGIDIVLSKESGQQGIVQCKRFSKKVGPATIRDLYGTMRAGGYKYGFVVCPSGFSDKAYEFSKGKNIKLIGLKRIIEMVGENQK